jgi:uncharacterized protein
MRQPVFLVLFLSVFIVLTDLYTFRGVSALSQSLGNRQRLLINLTFWFITALGLAWLLWMTLSFRHFNYAQTYRNLALFIGFFILFYVPKLFFNAFQLVNDIAVIIAKTVKFLFPSNEAVSNGALKISRSDFLIQLGLIVATIPFISIIWGMWKGRYNFKVSRVSLSYPNLPLSFSGTKIVQISDFHIGSFAGNPEMVEKAIRLINRQEPDYIFFTGDLVNNIATEVEEFIPLLAGLKAKYGKYSILGNHDYGEYFKWESEELHRKNMEALFSHHASVGFRLLRNEAVKLEKDGEAIALIGVENWGLPPFPQYGKLDKSLEPVKDMPFKILMSHDPSHWDAEVVNKTDIDLTLSGHTHGMQFAIRIPGWRWSPVSMKYPRWAGLYTQGKQNLYVNIGIGYIAFPGRVGTPPEITLFELNT